jgi:hypothetical protein
VPAAASALPNNALGDTPGATAMCRPCGQISDQAV